MTPDDLATTKRAERTSRQMPSPDNHPPRALEGLRVLDFATFIAAPFYLHLRHRYGSTTAFNRAPDSMRINRYPASFYFDFPMRTMLTNPVKHNLARVRDSLPNGYCGRPPQQDCPHPNACLTCPDFQTTVEFLGVHRDQADRNRKLIAVADANGQFRLAANHRRVQDSLERIIPALEALEGADG